MMVHQIPSSRAVLDSVPNPILVLDAGNQISQANAAAEDFFQMSKSVLLRQNFTTMVPFSSPILDSVESVRKNDGVVNEYGIAIGTPRTGGERMIDLQTSAVADDPGFVVLMIQRRSIAQKLDHQLSHRGAARSVAGMASMLAHEIKNPLAGIRGAAQLLETSVHGDDIALAQLIRDETDRIRDLVDKMEVFSDERPVERRPINIHTVLDRVKQLISASAQHDVKIKEDYDPSLPNVFANYDQLVQVFLNLAVNAAEAIAATGEYGEIILTTAFKPGMRLSVSGSEDKISLPLEVCVHDSGVGVVEDIKQYIFDPFVTSKASGKGLGLALVAKIIGDHGGVVECLPRSKGTTFRVLLPLMQKSAVDQLTEVSS